MKHFLAVIAVLTLSVLTTVSVSPAAIADTTTVTLTVVSGSLHLDSSSGEPVVTDQRGTSTGWILSDTTDDDGTRTISVL